MRGGQAILIVVSVASVSFAARVKHQTGSKLQAQLAVVDKVDKVKALPPFAAGDLFVCMPKFLKGKGLFSNPFSDSGSIVNADCLVPLKEIEASMPRFPYRDEMEACQAKSKVWTMKLCGLKGKKDKRVHYSGRVYVPKSCMFPATDTGMKDVPFMVAKFDSTKCEGMANSQTREQQGIYATMWPKKEEPKLLWVDPVVDEVRTELKSIYTQHRPDKLPDVEGLLAEWKGQEKDLLANVKAKYLAIPAELPQAAEAEDTTDTDEDDTEDIREAEDEDAGGARELTPEELETVKVIKTVPDFDQTMSRWQHMADGQTD